MDCCPECKFCSGAHRVGCSLMPVDMQEAFIQMAEKMLSETPEDRLIRFLFYVLEDNHIEPDAATRTKIAAEWLHIIRMCDTFHKEDTNAQ